MILQRVSQLKNHDRLLTICLFLQARFINHMDKKIKTNLDREKKET